MERQDTNVIEQQLNTLRGNGFDIQDGWLGYDHNGFKELANIVAWIGKETIVDDGKEVSRRYEISGRVIGSGRLLPTLSISAAEFIGSMKGSLYNGWGIDIRIRGSINYFRESIQCLSPHREVVRLYTHTGWRNINDEWTFLHGGGALENSAVQVDLSEGGTLLERYRLPQASQDYGAAASAALSTLELAQPQIAYPLFAATFYAPLTEVLRKENLQADFVVFLNGRTQSGKSSLAAWFLSFFGDFDKNSFPLNYQCSAASLERACFLLKDVVTVIDDYYPGQSYREQMRMKDIAQKLARLYGDGATNGRSAPNRKLQESLPPRGIAISTGEARPDISPSGQARYVFLDINRSSIDYQSLLEWQDRKPLLAQFMTAYLRWVATNWDRIPELFRNKYFQMKEKFMASGNTWRITDSIAKLYAAFHIVLKFACEKKYVSVAESFNYQGKLMNALRHIHQMNMEMREKPSKKFIDTISELLANDNVISSVACEPNDVPESNIGWYDEKYLYLKPTESFKAVDNYLAKSGKSLTVGDKSMWRLLREEKFIEGAAGGRSTIQKRLPCRGHIDKQNINVLQIPRGLIMAS